MKRLVAYELYFLPVVHSFFFSLLFKNVLVF